MGQKNMKVFYIVNVLQIDDFLVETWVKSLGEKDLGQIMFFYPIRDSIGILEMNF